MVLTWNFFLNCSALARNLDSELTKESTYMVETGGLVLIKLLFISKYPRWKNAYSF